MEFCIIWIWRSRIGYKEEALWSKSVCEAMDELQIITWFYTCEWWCAFHTPSDLGCQKGKSMTNLINYSGAFFVCNRCNINFDIFWSLQGCPHNIHIAALASHSREQSLHTTDDKKTLTLASALLRRKGRLVTSSTYNHFVVVGYYSFYLTGTRIHSTLPTIF